MNDDTLYELRQDPPEPFAAALHARLRANDVQEETVTWGRSVRVLLKPALAVGVCAALFAWPGVRASAQSFLALFRVRTFLAVPVNTARAIELNNKLDVEALVGGQVTVVREPGPPREVGSPELASTEAGFTVRLPHTLPQTATLARLTVNNDTLVQVTGNSERLAQVMEVLGIDDLDPPAGLDGQRVEIAISPTVFASYEVGGVRNLELVQALVPDVSLPSSVDMAALGEIALRIIGLPKADAHAMAQAIDWHSTLLVPLPPVARNYRQVNVAGEAGLLVEEGTAGSPRSLLLWSTTDRTYAMTGAMAGDELVTLASSVR
jgi:hypothetical protein